MAIANYTNGLAGIHDWTVNGGGATTLNVSDAGASSDVTYQIANNQITTNQGLIFAYDFVRSLNLAGSSGHDTFDVQSTASITTTNIVAHGMSTVNVGQNHRHFSTTT